jgi:hypothetical protein
VPPADAVAAAVGAAAPSSVEGPGRGVSGSLMAEGLRLAAGPEEPDPDPEPAPAASAEAGSSALAPVAAAAPRLAG